MLLVEMLLFCKVRGGERIVRVSSEDLCIDIYFSMLLIHM